jgi:hypothetical protein
MIYVIITMTLVIKQHPTPNDVENMIKMEIEKEFEREVVDDGDHPIPAPSVTYEGENVGQNTNVRSRQVVVEAFLYPMVFFATWIFGTINRAHSHFHPGEPVFELLFLHALFVPLQGTFNAVVYFHPHILRYFHKRGSSKIHAAGGRSPQPRINTNVSMKDSLQSPAPFSLKSSVTHGSSPFSNWFGFKKYVGGVTRSGRRPSGPSFFQRDSSVLGQNTDGFDDVNSQGDVFFSGSPVNRDLATEMGTAAREESMRLGPLDLEPPSMLARSESLHGAQGPLSVNPRNIPPRNSRDILSRAAAQAKAGPKAPPPFIQSSPHSQSFSRLSSRSFPEPSLPIDPQ